MGKMEIITRTERRRRWSDAERAVIMAEADKPGVTIRSVAKRFDVSEGLVHAWREARRKAKSDAADPVQFFAYGAIDSDRSLPSAIAPTPTPTPSFAPRVPDPHPDEGILRPHPGPRPGSIDIALRSGVRLSVDSYVNERSLLRVLRALKAIA